MSETQTARVIEDTGNPYIYQPGDRVPRRRLVIVDHCDTIFTKVSPSPVPFLAMIERIVQYTDWAASYEDHWITPDRFTPVGGLVFAFRESHMFAAQPSPVKAHLMSGLGYLMDTWHRQLDISTNPINPGTHEVWPVRSYNEDVGYAVKADIVYQRPSTHNRFYEVLCGRLYGAYGLKFTLDGEWTAPHIALEYGQVQYDRRPLPVDEVISILPGGDEPIVVKAYVLVP
jgi:hypothetical protein